jgi:hypothetical protein
VWFGFVFVSVQGILCNFLCKFAENRALRRILPLAQQILRTSNAILNFTVLYHDERHTTMHLQDINYQPSITVTIANSQAHKLSFILMFNFSPTNKVTQMIKLLKNITFADCVYE